MSESRPFKIEGWQCYSIIPTGKPLHRGLVSFGVLFVTQTRSLATQTICMCRPPKWMVFLFRLPKEPTKRATSNKQTPTHPRTHPPTHPHTHTPHTHTHHTHTHTHTHTHRNPPQKPPLQPSEFGTSSPPLPWGSCCCWKARCSGWPTSAPNFDFLFLWGGVLVAGWRGGDVELQFLCGHLLWNLL